MTDPTPGPEPTLAELLDELIGEASAYRVPIDDPYDRPTVIELRATILARFGGDKVCVDRDDLGEVLEYCRGYVIKGPESVTDYFWDKWGYQKHYDNLLAALAPTETEAAAKEEVSGGPG